MRKLKKMIHNIKILFLFRNKIQRVKEEIKKEFHDVQFRFASFGGTDINFFIQKDNKKFAMLRLAILDKQDDVLPIVRFNIQKRLNKEYMAYSTGSIYALTPKVLYYSGDALVCEYLSGERVFDILQKDKSKVWDILVRAVKTYKKLHSLNIVHLDATLKNFIMDSGQMKVIDFEYYVGMDDFTLEEQKAYDYIRIIEHTLRVIPEKYQKDYYQFIEDLDKVIPIEIRQTEFSHVKPWIKNIQKYPIYTALQERIFTKLTFN